MVSQDECTIPKWLLYGSLLTKEFDHMAEAKKMVNIKGPGIRQFFLMCAMWIWLWINIRTPNVQQVGSFAKVDVSQLQCFIILNILNHQQIYQMLHFILKLTVHPQSLSHHILSQKKTPRCKPCEGIVFWEDTPLLPIWRAKLSGTIAHLRVRPFQLCGTAWLTDFLGEWVLVLGMVV